MGRRIDITGKRFGRLVALAATEKRMLSGAVVWSCICDCGNAHEVSISTLGSGTSQSCGCLLSDTAAAKGRAKKTHGMTCSPTYTSWSGAKSRCNNKDDPKYLNYGGRGIRMDATWGSSFEAFFAYMGARPTGTSLDRFPDNNGNYEPGNCRWATQVQQQNNRRDNVYIELGGERATMAEYCRAHGLNVDKVQARLARGVPAARAVQP